MKSIIGFVQRYPLLVYFILAYAFAWVLMPLIAISPTYGVPGLFAPALAGFIVSRAVGGRAQAAAWFGKLAIWRVHIVWYLVALGLPVLLSFLIGMLARFFGSFDIQPAPITPLASIVFVLVVGEEMGWRGFAQPQLEKRFSPLIAAIFLGVLWGFWHLPNFLIPNMPQFGLPLAPFVLFTTGLSVLAAWLLKFTRGSVFITTLLHGSVNTLGFLTPGLDAAIRMWLTAAVFCGAAVVVVVIYGTRLDHARPKEVLMDTVAE